MAHQAKISAARLQRRIGQEMTVLVDEVNPVIKFGKAMGTEVVARSYADAPEIDGVVRLRAGSGKVAVGDLIRVRITGATEHDLQAEWMG